VTAGSVKYRKENLWEEIRLSALSFLCTAALKMLGRTVRFKVSGYERVQELTRSGSGLVIAVWHGYTFLPVYYCRRSGLWAMASLSRDGELLARALGGLGYNIIRGSTRRGGIKAALSACRKIEEGCSLAITPDGPLGPACKVQAGTVFIAKKTGCPVIPLGVAAYPGLRVPTWDKYMLPYPFARCSLFFGEPVYLSEEDAGAEGAVEAALEDVRRRAEHLLALGEF
jgi:lysophospholipid acyltransferase (LPLAT)-like uncharacterized protein